MEDPISANQECGECQRLTAEIQQLKAQIQVLEKQTLTDHLTKLPNRRAFEKLLDEVMHQYKMQHEPFSVAALDIDFFKRINDNGGHPAGDRVLKQLSRLLNEIKRKEDFVARWGGEEFMILFHNTPLSKAKMILEAFCVHISQEIGTTLNGEWSPVTVSIGVAEIDENENINELIDRVDVALYRAKNTGKDCVVCAH